MVYNSFQFQFSNTSSQNRYYVEITPVDFTGRNQYCTLRNPVATFTECQYNVLLDSADEKFYDASYLAGI